MTTVRIFCRRCRRMQLHQVAQRTRTCENCGRVIHIIDKRRKAKRTGES